MLAMQLAAEDKVNPVMATYRAEEKTEVHDSKYLIARPPPAFVPPTRRGFVKFFDNTFADEGEEAANFTLAPRDPTKFDPNKCSTLSDLQVLKYQQFIREYLRGATPYRGLLVYHGLGSGKTCSAIAAAEALFGASGKRIIIMTPGSLRGNFQAQISFCGFRHFRVDNHWVFLEMNPVTRTFAETVLGIPPAYIDNKVMARAAKGIWVPDFTKPSNYASLGSVEQTQIREQIHVILENRVTFINYNGILPSKLKKMVCDAAANPGAPGPFDNAVIIVDEIHNLSRLMQNNIHGYMEQLPTRGGRPRLVPPEPVTPDRWKPRLCAMARNYKRGFLLYRLIAEAKNSKVIGLSGTPLMNFPDEIGPLMNMIGGYIHGAKLIMRNRDPAAIKVVQEIAAAHPRIDFFEAKPDQVHTTITLTVFLDGYVKVLDGAKDFLGLKEDRDGDGLGAEGQKGPAVVAEELMAKAKAAMAAIDFPKAPELISYPLFPVNPQEFNKYFVDTETLEAINVPTLKKRLYGLVSYYKGSDPELMPEVQETIVPIRFSEYSLQYYTRRRVQELAESPAELTGAGEVNPYEDIEKAGSTANYRFNSRAACNFAFPGAIPRPYRSLKKQAEAAAAAELDDAPMNKVIAEDDYEDGAAEAAEVAEVAAEEAVAVPAVEEEVPAAEEGAGAGAGAEAPPPPIVVKFLRDAAQEAAAAGISLEEEGEGAGGAGRIEPYEIRLQKALARLRAQKDMYLKVDGPADSNLEKYSPKFAAMYRTINHPEQSPGSCLIYSQFMRAEGLGIFGYVLEANGYHHIEFTASEADPAFTPETEASMKKAGGDKRFMFFTGEQSPARRKIILDLFNGRISQLPPKIQAVMRAANYEELGNKNGEICKVIGITGAGAEGISLKFVRAVHIMEPYWNDVRLEQVKGRAVRICSHAEVPREQRNVQVFVYYMHFAPEDDKRIIQSLKIRDKNPEGQGTLTSDNKVLQISMNKRKLNQGFLKIIKEAAVDCVLNSGENEELACYTGIEGNPAEVAMQPDIKEDIDKSKIEERVVPVAAAAAAGPAAIVGGLKREVPKISLKLPGTTDVREYMFEVDKELNNPNMYLVYELTDRALKRPVARLFKNPITAKGRYLPVQLSEDMKAEYRA